MALESIELNRNFILADESMTVGQLRDRVVAGQSLWVYIVVRAGGTFAVFRLNELIDALWASSPVFRPEMLALTLTSTPGLLAPRMASPLEEGDLSANRIRMLIKDAPEKRWVVLKGGDVTGVVASETRGGALRVDLQWLNAELAAPSAPPPVYRGALPGADLRDILLAADVDEVRSGAGGGMLTASGPPSAAAKEPILPPEPVKNTEKRFINAEIEGHRTNEPLRVDKICAIAFDVDVVARPGSLAKEPFLGSFAAGEEMIELTVQLSSADFKIWTEPQRLWVPLHGRSPNKARFDISPKHDGPAMLQAVFLKGGNFVQVVTVNLEVGGVGARPISVSQPHGRSLDASSRLQPRDVSLVLTNIGSSFQATFNAGTVCATATLPITLPELNQMIEQARQELQSVVGLASGVGGKPYQSGIDIPPEVADDALRVVAKAGFRLFQRIFFGPAADAQSILLGTRLREMAQKNRLKIQILSERFLLPWGILYMANPPFDPAHINPEMFLGFKHVIEHIPLQPGMQVLEEEIDGRPLLSVSLNLNADIDAQMGISVIADQLRYWNETSKRVSTKLVVRTTDDEVKQALADSSSPDQLLYFYCHAVGKSLSQGGPDASALVLTGNHRVTLGDLAIFAPMGNALVGAPLVFINACESAELSPLFYDGFVPYFMGKGARGVIGTECQTPALFAAEWARRFFDEFLKGKTVGEVFLDLRREFYEQHNNLLGLLYALYCDGDTQLVSAAA